MVLDPVDYPPDIITPYELEETLVHELLHLHFAPFMSEHDTLERTLQEQAIDAIAKALVSRYGGGESVVAQIQTQTVAAETQAHETST